jgi:hypothetical protein
VMLRFVAVPQDYLCCKSANFKTVQDGYSMLRLHKK